MDRSKSTSKMLRAPEVVAMTGRSRTSLWRDVRAGMFPAPIQIGPNAIGWLQSDVEAWIRSRSRRTYGADSHFEAGAFDGEQDRS